MKNSGQNKSTGKEVRGMNIFDAIFKIIFVD